MPTPKPPKYDEAAHKERILKLLMKRIATLPQSALVTLLEAATLLEAGGVAGHAGGPPEARDDRSQGPAPAARRDGDDALGAGHDPAAPGRSRADRRGDHTHTGIHAVVAAAGSSFVKNSREG